MSRVRHNENNRRTAAAYDQEQGSGCLSFYWLPPLSVLFFSVAITVAAINIPMQVTTAAYVGTITASNKLAPLFTPEIQHWDSDIVRWSSSFTLDPNLVATIMQIESCGNADARSSAGAAGLFQVMPDHFASAENPYDPETNALRGLSYLRGVFDTSKQNIVWSLAAYNGGPGLIGSSQRTWPAETVRYVYWGSGIYTDAAQMKSTSSRLDEWLAAGGASLCDRAHQQLGLP
jgi:soluble lytic murein transglycosylase-like protein